MVVALHGAGADETAFLEAYGAGRIRRLADSLGFIVVTPFTNAMMRTSANLPGHLDDVATQGPIDRARVYLLGHSLGGGTAWRLASVGPVVPPARLKIAVDQAHAIGWNVENRELLNQGHTLMVGSFIDQAIAWLLTLKP